MEGTAHGDASCSSSTLPTIRFEIDAYQLISKNMTVYSLGLLHFRVQKVATRQTEEGYLMGFLIRSAEEDFYSTLNLQHPLELEALTQVTLLLTH